MTDTPQDLPPEGERRASVRVSVDFPVGLSKIAQVTVTAASGESLRGRARDLCKDAVLVEADRSFPLGTELNIAFEASGSGPPLELEGKVVRMGPRKPGVMAIAFSNITPESQAAIDALIG